MLLTSPLVTTVGLSLTIPVSLVGQMIEYKQTKGILYWLGACIVLLAFVFINYESTHGEEEGAERDSTTFSEKMRGYLRGIQDRFRSERY